MENCYSFNFLGCFIYVFFFSEGLFIIQLCNIRKYRLHIITPWKTVWMSRFCCLRWMQTEMHHKLLNRSRQQNFPCRFFFCLVSLQKHPWCEYTTTFFFSYLFNCHLTTDFNWILIYMLEKYKNFLRIAKRNRLNDMKRSKFFYIWE